MARVSTIQTRLGTAFLWRALPAILAAGVITFSRNHSAIVGLSVFGGYAIVLAVVLLVSIARVPLTGFDRIFTALQVGVGLISGILALVNLDGSLSTLILILSIWGGLSALIDLYASYRHGNRAIAREWLTLGGFTALLALIVVLFPVNDVYAVGLFGAYAAILGVYLVIAGLSLRTDGTNPSNTTTTNSEGLEAQS